MYKAALLSEIVYFTTLVKFTHPDTLLGGRLLYVLNDVVDDYLNVSPEIRNMVDHEPNSVICTFS